MNARFWNVAAALCLVASAIGCKKDDGHTPTPVGPSLSMTASATTVVANGTNTVTLNVTDTGGVAVTVTTDRGSFSTGGQSYAIAAGSGVTTGSVTLVTCSSTTAGCAGAATVTATSTTGQVTRSINFTSLAAACAVSCAADSGCPGQACTVTGGGSGTCSASSPSVCSAGTTPVNPNARLGGFAIPSPFATHPVMGVKSSGWNEFGSVTVQVLDDQNQPWAAGLTVRFEHRQLGGSTFGAPLATTSLGACTAAANCVAYDAVTVEGGFASVPLLAGTVAGTLVVTASTTAGTETRTVTLPGVAVVGAKASGANFSIQCSPRNVPALAETDCSTSWVDAPITCAAFLKDRFNNLLGTSTQVIFASEAAAVGQVTWTPEYNRDATGDGQPDLGSATQIFQTLGAGLPFDVTPQTGEPFVSHGYDGCGTRTHNPRDGVVTIIAIADGEEAFFDANANGIYDPPVGTTAGEPFIDMGEPYVDQNDNGAWDPGEWFVDVDHSGTYTGPNGKWDAQAKIWTQTIVVYTGAPATTVKSATAPETYLGTRWIDDVAAWTDACTPTPAPVIFSIDSEVAGTPPTPATSTTYYVTASDMNLNRLATATSYDVKPFGDAKLKATYRGLAKYADEHGMSYRYWPCDQAATPSCAAQCRAAVGGTTGTGPCLMKPQVSGFECGFFPVDVIITGGSEADVGPVEIDWLVDTPWQNFVEGRIAKHIEPLYGYSDNDPLTPP